MFAELAQAYIDIILGNENVKKSLKKWDQHHIDEVRKDNVNRVAKRMADYFEDKNKDGKLDFQEVKDGFFHL